MSSSSQDDQALFNMVSKQFSNAQQHLNNYGFGIQSNNTSIGLSENNLSPYESSGFSSFPNITTYIGGGGGGGALNQAPPAHVGNMASQPSWSHCPSLIMIANNGVENCTSHHHPHPQPYHGYPGGVSGANYYQAAHSGYHQYGPSIGNYYHHLTNEFLNQPLNLSDVKAISAPSLIHRQPFFNPYMTGGGAVAAGPSPALSLSENRTSLLNSRISNDRHSLFETGLTENDDEVDDPNNEDETGSSDISDSETPQMPNMFLTKSRLSAFQTVLPTSSLEKDYLTMSSSSEENSKIDLPSFSDILANATMTTTPASLSGQTNISVSDVPIVRTPDSSEKLPPKRSRGRPTKTKTTNVPHQKGNFTKEQVGILEEKFADYPFIRNATERKYLAERLNVTEHRITVWFQNRRTKERRHGALPKGTLPSDYFK